ncbi:MAG: adenylate/guanylate cyclase domain-containing protein, partial [Chloroflexota bacterium]
MSNQETNIDRLLKARAEIDEELRRHKASFTILFTDVVGSTAYFDRYGDTAGVAMLHRHAELAASTVNEFQGSVVKTIGDSVMAEFREPTRAVRAAIEMQRRLLRLDLTLAERDRVQLRIGIHAGVGYRSGTDVYGDVVNFAARITKRTGPAQI